VRGLTDEIILRSSAASGDWLLKAVLLDGKDVTDSPLRLNGNNVDGVTVVLTKTRTRVSGTLLEQARATDYVAVFFATDQRLLTRQTRYIGAIRSDQRGRFVFDRLPAGTYFAAAIGRLSPGDEYNPMILSRIRPRAVTVDLKEGESTSVRLPLVSF
jgi:hypothetical protein